MLKIEEEIASCIERWTGIEDGFKIKFENWLKNIPEEYLDIILNLLRNFDYYSQEKIIGYFEELHETLLSFDDFNLENTMFTFIHNTKKMSNSSNEYWSHYILKNNLIQFAYVDLIHPTLSTMENIVVIDDFSGTAKTFIDWLTPNIEKIADKKIFFLTIHLMEEAKNAIEIFSKDNNIVIYPLYIRLKKHAFISAPQDIKSSFLELSSQLDIKIKLGFGNSESLVSFYKNTPNNTLGIFWEENAKNSAIFPRKNTTKLRLEKIKIEKLKRNERKLISQYSRECEEVGW